MISIAQNHAYDTLSEQNKTPRPIRTLALSPEQQELLSFEADDDGNARAVVHLYGDTIRYTNGMGWLYWNGKYWEGDKHKAVQAVIETLRKRKALAEMAGNDQIARKSIANASNVRGIMTILEGHVHAKENQFDNEHDFLPVQNGIIDLRTGELMEHDPAMGFTFASSVEYDPDADDSEWENALRSCVASDEELATLQAFVGYMLTGHTREEKMLYISGPPRSGKGMFTETIKSLLPDPIAQEKSINTFTAKRDEDTNNFDMASLRSARMVFASESARYQALNEAKVKAITGGNEVWAAYKGKDGFSFKPKFKIVLTSNFEVNADPDDDALWGRLIVILFPNSHLDNEDTHLKERLRTEKARQGVLKWGVEGAKQWYKQGRLIVPARIKENAQKQREKLDTVSMWVDDCVIEDEKAFTTSAVIRESYERWCRELGVDPKKAKFFTAALKKRLPTLEQALKEALYHEYTQGMYVTTEKRQRGYIGLRIR